MKMPINVRSAMLTKPSANLVARQVMGEIALKVVVPQNWQSRFKAHELFHALRRRPLLSQLGQIAFIALITESLDCSTAGACDLVDARAA
jgi:hypothetical protein